MCCIIHVGIHGTLILSHYQRVLQDLHRWHNGLLLVQELIYQLLLLSESGRLLLLARKFVRPTIRGVRGGRTGHPNVAIPLGDLLDWVEGMRILPTSVTLVAIEVDVVVVVLLLTLC
jgi:hypothetical protein